MRKVIACIDNDREIFSRQDLGESVSELRTANASSKSNDFQLLSLQLQSIITT